MNAAVSIAACILGLVVGYLLGWSAVQIQARNIGAYWPEYRFAWANALYFVAASIITLISVALRSNAGTRKMKRVTNYPSWTALLHFPQRLAITEVLAYPRRFIASTTALALLFSGITISSLFLGTAVFSAQHSAWWRPLPEDSARLDLTTHSTDNQLSLLQTQRAGKPPNSSGSASTRAMG